MLTLRKPRVKTIAYPATIVAPTMTFSGFPLADELQIINLKALTYFVGPNGSGKTVALRNLASGMYQYEYGDAINTPHRDKAQQHMLVMPETTETLLACGNALFRILRDEDAHRRFQQIVMGYADWLCGVRIKPTTVFNKAGVEYYRMVDGAPILVSHPIATGLTRFTFYAALACDPQGPPLLCIDKPEIGLDYTLRETVAQLLEDLSRKVQVCAITYAQEISHYSKDAAVFVFGADGNGKVKECRCRVCLAREQRGLLGWFNRLRFKNKE